MEDLTVTKRSPLVLIGIFAAIELAALLLYLLGTLPFVDVYKQTFYDFFPFSSAFPYGAFKLPFLFFVQFLITVYAFLRWYYGVYTVRPGSVSYEHGVFVRRKETVPLDASVRMTVSSGPLGEAFRYGTVRVENGSGGALMTILAVPRPQSLAERIRACADPLAANFAGPPDLTRLLAEDEHESLEFKSSLRFDHKTGQPNRELEKAAMKTIAAFLNSKGGHLVIGLDDAKRAVGLSADYKTLKRPDSDGFENHFTQVFNSMIGPEFRRLVGVSFHPFGGDTVCVIRSAPSERPVYLKNENSEHFYIRTGNVTTPLKLSEIEQYARSRWPHRVASA